MRQISEELRECKRAVGGRLAQTQRSCILGTALHGFQSEAGLEDETCSPSLPADLCNCGAVLVAPVRKSKASGSLSSLRFRRRRALKRQSDAVRVQRRHSGASLVGSQSVLTGSWFEDDALHGARLEELLQLLAAWGRKDARAGKASGEEGSLYVALWLLPEQRLEAGPGVRSEGESWSHEEVLDLQHW